MFKWLLLTLLVTVAYLLWQKGRVSRSDSAAPPKGTARVERMVACARCGVHTPESDSVRGDGGDFFCCEDHRRLGAGRGN